MRQSIKKLSIDGLEWVPTGTPGVVEKIINEDPVNGARTLMLKSASRPANSMTDRRPQFHPVDEEFFCLAGRFTLEGHPWLTPGTYVYYPPYLVHGYGVDVPEGYEIYLRNSGALSTERVDSPAEGALHFIEASGVAHADVCIRNAASFLQSAPENDACSLGLLRSGQGGGEGAFVCTVPANTRIASPEAGYEGFLEVFVLSGAFEITGQDTLSARDYAFFPPSTPLELIGRNVMSSCLVNYCSEDVYRHFSHVASNSVKLSDIEGL